MGKSSINVPFSIAMLNNQRGTVISGGLQSGLFWIVIRSIWQRICETAYPSANRWAGIGIFKSYPKRMYFLGSSGTGSPPNPICFCFHTSGVVCFDEGSDNPTRTSGLASPKLDQQEQHMLMVMTRPSKTFELLPGGSGESQILSFQKSFTGLVEENRKPWFSPSKRFPPNVPWYYLKTTPSIILSDAASLISGSMLGSWSHGFFLLMVVMARWWLHHMIGHDFWTLKYHVVLLIVNGLHIKGPPCFIMFPRNYILISAEKSYGCFLYGGIPKSP